MDDEVLMKFKPTRITIKHPKRLIIIIVSVIVVAALAMYGTLSYLHWQTYDQDSKKAATSLKAAIDSSLGSDDTSPSPQVQIDTIVTDFEKAYGTDPCGVSSWYRWQTVISQLNEMRDTCTSRFETALKVIKTLKPLSEFLTDEKKASEVLATTTEATKAPTDYAAAASIWKNASESTQLSDADNFMAITTKFTEVASAISAAYTALADAISNEDKAAFDTTTANLTAAYTGIDQIKTTVNEERTKLVSTFITSYKKL